MNPRRSCFSTLALVAALLSEAAAGPVADPFAARRNRMVKEDILARGVTDPATLRAMQSVPRHLFVPEALVDRAYGDHPLPIGHGQTISQPYIVAYMTEQARPQRGHRVLEIGTGSGYQAAVLSSRRLWTRCTPSRSCLPWPSDQPSCCSTS